MNQQEGRNRVIEARFSCGFVLGLGWLAGKASSRSPARHGPLKHDHPLDLRFH
jgi:hypothetical protein